MTDQVVVDVNLTPAHDIELHQDGTGGVVRAVCSCGRYTSISTSTRQKAYRLGQGHAFRAVKEWKSAL